MPKANLLITNGGLGGTQQALAEGVTGDHRQSQDKPFTAARVAAYGVGRDLGTSTPTFEQIHDHLGPRRPRAKKIAGHYREYDAISLLT